MRMFKALMTALVALAFLAGLSAPAAAQSDEPLQIEDLDGLERAVARQFGGDAPAMSGTAEPGGWFALVTMVLAFDSEDAAAAAVTLLDDELVSTFTAGVDAPPEAIQLDVELEHEAYLLTFAMEDGAVTTLVVIARDGSYVDIVVGSTFGEDPQPLITSTLEAMVDAEAGEGEGTFDKEGASEGGLWDKLPDAETVTAVAPELIEVEDEELYPDPSRPAISTPARVTVPVTESTPAG